MRRWGTWTILLAAAAALVLLVPAPGRSEDAAAPPRRDGSAERPLIIGMDDEYRPYQYLNDEGRPEGFSHDIFQTVADELGLHVRYRAGPWNEVRAALERGEIDAIAGMYRSESRAESVHFTRRYKVVRHSAFIKEDDRPVSGVEDLRGRSVIVLERDIAHDFASSRGLDESLTTVQTVPEALTLLNTGDFDAAIVPFSVGRYIAGRLGLNEVVPSGPTLFIVDFCIATAPDRPDLRDTLDDGLQRIIDSGRRDEIYDEWFGPIDPRSTALGTTARVLGWIAGGLLALLGAALLWTRLLHIKVRERTDELAAELAERRTAEETARRSEERYKALVSTMTPVTWTTDPEGNFIEPQPTWEAYTGHSWDVHMGGGWGTAIHPDDFERVTHDFLEQLRTRKIRLIEGRLWSAAHNTYRRFEGRGVPILNPDGSVREWIGTVTDVEDRYAVQREREESRARLAAIIGSAMDPIITADADGHIVMFNAAAERDLRIIAADAIGLPVCRFIPEWRENPVHNGLSRPPATAERADGEVFPVDASVSRVEAHGQVLYTLILRDITERERNERRQNLMVQELDHRVKNNLAAVLSIADTTAAGCRSLDEFTEAFRGRILALARSHVALAESRWLGADLRALIEQTIRPYRDTTELDIQGEPVTLPPDNAAAVSMTLNELCTNAAKHGALACPDGTVSIRWHIEPGAQGDIVHFTWTERGGPSRNGTRREGTGMRLMQGLVRHELGGAVDFDFDDTGLDCRIHFALGRNRTRPSLD